MPTPIPPTRAAVEALMKRCQRGVSGRNALYDAHDIMADCYGMLGAMLICLEAGAAAIQAAPAAPPAANGWKRDDSMTADVLAMASRDAAAEVVAGWTDEQCIEAEAWATAVHFRASDNNVKVPPTPPHVAALPVLTIASLMGADPNPPG